MGKRAKKFKPKHNSNKKVKGDWNSTTIPTENALFRSYYQLQLQLSPQEFDIFWAMMREKLPVVFRINPSSPNYSAFRDKVQNSNFLESMVDMTSQPMEEPREKEWLQPKEMPKLEVLSWYPHQVVHQLNTSKQMFKKSKVLNSLHQYLQKAFEAGLIARQELVSMLPPLYLDIKSDDIVLDMCAAPGSKTSQLLEMIYGEEKHLAKGCVIANDADYGRAQMLIHQINRSGTAGMAVINHPGQFMPELYSQKNNHIKEKFQFDKILCDVPCSGDGATRKIPIKWAQWHPSDGVALHPLQLAILMKSINLLRKGGLIVYSTCSLNPIENQAVLSALFSKVSQGLELVDIHGMYNMKSRRGMLNWKVCGVETTEETVEGQEKPKRNRKLINFNSFEDVKGGIKIKESMFPPSLEEAQKMQLHHSLRMLPHDQNSGGFFVALLKKHDEFEWKYLNNDKNEGQQDQEENFVEHNLPEVDNPVFDENEERKEEESNSEGEEDHPEEKPEAGQMVAEEKLEKLQIKEKGAQKKMQEKNKSQVDSKDKKSKNLLKYQKFENLSENQFDSIEKFYALDPSLKKLLYVRDIEGSTKNKVLLISEGVRQFLDADFEARIKLVNMGCKVFEKGKESFAGHECLYRLTQEGIQFLLPFLKARKIKVNLDFFRQVIKIHSLVHQSIEDENVRGQMREMTQGSFCIFIQEQINGKLVTDAVVGQNFKNSFHLLVGKEELASLNLRYL